MKTYNILVTLVVLFLWAVFVHAAESPSVDEIIECANKVAYYSGDDGRSKVKMTITDSGPGISVENIERIFEPFFSTRGSADTTGQIGTGLGLAICRDIVTTHGGFIEVQSVEGQGASFKILLHGKPT